MHGVAFNHESSVERPPLERFLAEKDQFLKDEKPPDENKLYID
jgi:hypothetical protein